MTASVKKSNKPKKTERSAKRTKKANTSTAPEHLPPLRLGPLSKPEELKELRTTVESAIKERLGFDSRPFQVDAIEAQLLGKDVVVHAGTGMGKTVVAAGPHFHPSAEGKLTIMVSPLVALQDEQVETFAGMGVKAVAVNSSHGGCSPEVLESLKAGHFQILLISPELLLSRRFIDEMLRDKAFTSRILAMVVDEAHVVSHWGAGFRKRYGELGMVRAFLQRGTPVVAMSATLASRVRRDVLKKLEFSQEGWVFVNVGNDRPNVALAVRAIEHAMNTYADLDFIIPGNATQASDIPATLLYADNVPHSADIIDHLEPLLPQHLQNTGLLRPFSAAYSHDYRAAAMKAFKAGAIRVLVCTDAAGMGCNLPAVDLVVQWKLPSSLSTFVQRAGRAARSASRTGLAVLLVERSTYEINLDEVKPKPKAKRGGKGKGKGKSDTKIPDDTVKRTKKELQAFALANGVKRGAHGGKKDEVVGQPCEKQPKADAEDEGLVAFVQTTVCRRRIITMVYENVHSSVPAVCCDLCQPSLLDRTRPGKPPKSTRQATIKKTDPVEAVKTALYTWRSSVHGRDFADAIFGPSGLMSDALVAKVATSGRISSLEGLTQIIGSWKLLACYGKDVLDVLLDIPAEQFTASTPESGAKKRSNRDDGEGEAQGQRQLDVARGDPPMTASSMASTSATAKSRPVPCSSSLPLPPPPTRPPCTPLHSAAPTTTATHSQSAACQRPASIPLPPPPLPPRDHFQPAQVDVGPSTGYPQTPQPSQGYPISLASEHPATYYEHSYATASRYQPGMPRVSTDYQDPRHFNPLQTPIATPQPRYIQPQGSHRQLSTHAMYNTPLPLSYSSHHHPTSTRQPPAMSTVTPQRHHPYLSTPAVTPIDHHRHYHPTRLPTPSSSYQQRTEAPDLVWHNTFPGGASTNSTSNYVYDTTMYNPDQ
ncbi:P-loop containing nucleoside triphosphate hydrolase protein [Coprinopsis sp. MPI-PUGE-AT-0042]|nr:P-loop containing nucleoside triphosphate hydrolase protein [Coprinopsis sp. MPI-PUGE-AT-0042]